MTAAERAFTAERAESTAGSDAAPDGTFRPRFAKFAIEGCDETDVESFTFLYKSIRAICMFSFLSDGIQ